MDLIDHPRANGLSLALFLAPEEKTASAPKGVGEIADQQFALPQIRGPYVDSGKLEGFIDLRAHGVRVAEVHVVGTGHGSEDLSLARLSDPLSQDTLQQLIRAQFLLVWMVGQLPQRTNIKSI